MNRDETITHALRFGYGGMSRNELCHLYDISHGKTILELGSMVGMSSFVMASVCDVLHCVDAWDDEQKHLAHDKPQQDVYFSFLPNLPVMMNNFLTNCNNFIESKKIIMHRGLTGERVQDFEDDYFDIILIDADHSYEGVKNDCLTYMNKLKSDGNLVFHDYNCGMWTGVSKLCNEMVDEKRLELVSVVERLASFKKV